MYVYLSRRGLGLFVGLWCWGFVRTVHDQVILALAVVAPLRQRSLFAAAGKVIELAAIVASPGLAESLLWPERAALQRLILGYAGDKGRFHSLAT